MLCTHAEAGKKGELEVSHFCKQCGVYLHIECFEAWHCEPEPVSLNLKFKMGVVCKCVFYFVGEESVIIYR